MNDVLFVVLKAVVSVAIIVVMRYVVPILKMKLQNILDDKLWDAIVKAVKSVEQTFTGEKQGIAKKNEVLYRITTWANSLNISITQEQLSELIESAVYIMNNEEKMNE